MKRLPKMKVFIDGVAVKPEEEKKDFEQLEENVWRGIDMCTAKIVNGEMHFTTMY